MPKHIGPRARDAQAPWGRKNDGTPCRKPGPIAGRPRKVFSKHPYHSKGWWADYRALNKERLARRYAAWAASNPDRARAIKERWRKSSPGKRCAATSRRRASKLSATPAWADHGAISALYELCSEMNASGGTRYVVDHIVPLQSPVVCGLHIAANLRVISYAENDKKRARLIEEIALHPTIANGLLRP